MRNDSFLRTLTTAAVVCLVCSMLVSAATVALRPLQERNRAWDRKRNVLLAAGLIDENAAGDIDALFGRIEARVIDLDTGLAVEGIDPETFDAVAFQRNPQTSRELSPAEDLAGLKRRGRYELVYLLRDSGRLQRVILPVRGKGLWSTMWGLVALGPDLNTIESFAFFAHGETPGLGGEVDNPRWRALWIGKKAFDAEGHPRIEVIKGAVDPHAPESAHQVDGLSGATLTGNGVTKLLRFWLGEQGFGPLLERLRAEVASSAEQDAAQSAPHRPPRATESISSMHRPQAAAVLRPSCQWFESL